MAVNNWERKCNGNEVQVCSACWCSAGQTAVCQLSAPQAVSLPGAYFKASTIFVAWKKDCMGKSIRAEPRKVEEEKIMLYDDTLLLYGSILGNAYSTCIIQLWPNRLRLNERRHYAAEGWKRRWNSATLCCNRPCYGSTLLPTTTP